MANKAKRHTHKYYRRKFSFATVWACALPDCNHYMPPHMEGMIEGKSTICWKCGEQTIIDSRTINMEKPLCTDCDTEAVAVGKDISLDEKLKELGALGKFEDM